MLPDFTDALPEASAESRSRRTTQGTSNGSRRETILSLVEMLLQSDEIKRKEPVLSVEADRDVPSVDEYLQDAGTDAFNKFSRRMRDFDRELRNFANAARQLGSSVAILSSAFHLRQRVAQINFLYRENAAALFPRKISRAPRESVIDCSVTGRRTRRGRTKTPSHIVRPTVNEDIDVEEFPNQMDYFAKDIGTFLNCLNEFPEFTDEAVNASILSFERDLQYWASCLREYSGQFRNSAVQRYVHDLSIEMGEHIDGITSTLSIFIEIGVPIIRFAQKHGATNLLNLSTVATFFSAVTATTMQFSYELGNDKLSTAVNCFWFASLVFSIAAAVNSLLGLTWKQAMYRSPGDRVPWWVLIWIKRSPLVFLVMSVACFSIGLCFFSYASGQAEITSTVTTVLTTLTSFGLCAVSAWFATERWIFMRYRGRKWLDDVLTEITETMLQNRVLDISRHGIEKVGSGLVFANSAMIRAFLAISARLRRIFFSGAYNPNKPDDHESVLPVSAEYVPPNISNSSSKESSTPMSHKTSRKSSEVTARPLSLRTDLSPSLSGPGSPSIAESQEKSPISDAFSATNTIISPATAAVSPGKQRWVNAVRAVRARGPSGEQPSAPPVPGPSSEPIRRRTGSSSNLTVDIQKKKPVTTKGAIARSRLSTLASKLKVLDTTHDLAAHTALVKHLEFSPDGKYLATSSWDRTSVIFKVGDPFVSHRLLGHHTKGGFVSQVAWSPDGRYLLTKMSKSVKVWTPENGVCKGTIERDEQIESVVWCYSGHKFLSVEGSQVHLLDITGQEFNVFTLGSIKVLEVAITPDDKRVLAIGPLLHSPSGLLPSKSRHEKRLIVYNIESRQMECLVPMLHEVRDITLVRKNELLVLISYENQAPPQLWKLEVIKDRENGREHSRLMLRHTYMPKSSVEFSGPSYFGGQNHELVLAGGKKGDIFIWDTESGALLHHIRGQAQGHGGDLTCLAWNHAASNPFMFASGSHDGTVHIWTKPPNSPDEALEDVDDTGLKIPHLGELSFFGDIRRSASPAHEDLRYLDSTFETPNLDYIRRATNQRPRAPSSASSSNTSIIKVPTRDRF
ncbi:hypothetical protein NP233_g11600 [Leucocoprinus birnbaumii]|uniref:WD40 repeat-like protein n=1 Tax=Leucocoprinus birnbaumii TaxID=56174 RepID=A0AAD5VJS9_9AGAR|nr:hypothetical protein NP233_g11600 [Leucocoprinus birnbaumii]